MSFLPEPLRMMVTNPRLGDFSSDGPVPYALRQKVTGFPAIPRDLSLSAKTVLVTGATSGVGLEASRQLLELGASLIIAARNQDRAQSVKQQFLEAVPSACVRTYELDMESLTSVDRFIDCISADGIISLDVALLNAGIFSRKRRRADDGTSHVMQINFRATAYLALRLLPFLQRGPAPGRLALVSSEAHAWSTFSPPAPPAQVLASFQSPQVAIDPAEEYNTAKLFLALFGRELAARTNPTRLVVVITTPGFCASGFFREGESLMTKLIYLTSARSSAQGGRLHVHAVTCPEDGLSGQYLRDGKKTRSVHARA